MLTERPAIHVYLVTYRRSHLLKRAISSVLSQTYANVVLHIVNDAPDDAATMKVVSEFDDRRLSLFRPVEKRGAARNFNLAFEDPSAQFVSILEDDNWWEPTFLDEIYDALALHPSSSLAVGNERIWKECTDGCWQDTGKTIWDFDGVRAVQPVAEDVCGDATLCNSSMLVRLDRKHDYRTPDQIPVDVTEHFRERAFTGPVVLMGKPLVNYAETLQTARSKDGTRWSSYQCLLIGSVFAALRDSRSRRALARNLWLRCLSKTSPRAVTLVMAGTLIREAVALVETAPLAALSRFSIWAVRHPMRLVEMSGLKRRYRQEFEYLTTASRTREVTEGYSA